MVTDNFLGQKRILIKRKFKADVCVQFISPHCSSVALIWIFCLEFSMFFEDLL